MVNETESGRSIAPTEKNGQEKKTPFYIANQVTYEGLDELQRLHLAYSLECHVALDGPPGVGKTQSVVEIGRILQLPLFTRTCSTRTSESHIVSYPSLVLKEGATVTSQIPGPLLRAMATPGIFYGDEFNLLKDDVQKRMNSAFDERRSIDRTDGVQIQAKPGFWAVISYNPSRGNFTRDLEDSVADRFIHIHFSRWSSDFKAFVTSRRAAGASRNDLSGSESFGIDLQVRGIASDGTFLKGEKKGSSLEWKNFFTGEISSSKPATVYYASDTSSLFYQNRDKNITNVLEQFEQKSFSEKDFARILARFTDLLHSLATTGKSPLLKQIGMQDLAKKEDLELLNIHETSPRIEIMALKHYRKLVEMNVNRYLAQSYAVRIVIDQVCYGQYRFGQLRELGVYDLVVTIARSLGLFADDTRYNTRLASQTILKEGES